MAETLAVKNHAKHIRIRLVQEEDAAFIVRLRNLDSVKEHLNPVGEDVLAQQQWIRTYKEREAEGVDFYFIILDTNDDMLGTIRIHDVDDDSYTVGSWAMLDSVPAYAGIETVINVFETGFYGLNKMLVRCSVLKTNKKVVRFHSSYGGDILGEDEREIHFQLARPVYEEIFKQKYKKYYGLTENDLE